MHEDLLFKFRIANRIKLTYMGHILVKSFNNLRQNSKEFKIE